MDTNSRAEPETYRVFRRDMKAAGYEVYEYRGRFWYQGPAVNTDRRNGPDLDDIIAATTVKVQWDGMGLDQVVYPTREFRRGGRGEEEED